MLGCWVSVLDFLFPIGEARFISADDIFIWLHQKWFFYVFHNFSFNSSFYQTYLAEMLIDRPSIFWLALWFLFFKMLYCWLSSKLLSTMSILQFFVTSSKNYVFEFLKENSWMNAIQLQLTCEFVMCQLTLKHRLFHLYMTYRGQSIIITTNISA